MYIFHCLRIIYSICMAFENLKKGLFSPGLSQWFVPAVSTEEQDVSVKLHRYELGHRCSLRQS